MCSVSNLVICGLSNVALNNFGLDTPKPGLEVIKLEYSLKFKIKGNDWLLVRKQPFIALYFEFEN